MIEIIKALLPLAEARAQELTEELERAEEDDAGFDPDETPDGDALSPRQIADDAWAVVARAKTALGA